MALQRNDLRYDYAGDSRLLEGADWFGARAMGLQAHYHDEVQVSIIWHGSREYRINGQLFVLHPFQVLVIASKVPHRALPSRNGQLRSAEFYLDPDVLEPALAAQLPARGFLVLDRPELRDVVLGDVRRAGPQLADRVATMLTASTFDPTCCFAAPRSDTLLEDTVLGTADIAAAAGELGYTPEGLIRVFARQVGLTPHAYKINHRLNAARRLLRGGAGLADVAGATGFSDQSHFGRTFLRHFGATPGHFQAAHRSR